MVHCSGWLGGVGLSWSKYSVDPRCTSSIDVSCRHVVVVSVGLEWMWQILFGLFWKMKLKTVLTKQIDFCTLSEVRTYKLEHGLSCISWSTVEAVSLALCLEWVSGHNSVWSEVITHQRIALHCVVLIISIFLATISWCFGQYFAWCTVCNQRAHSSVTRSDHWPTRQDKTRQWWETDAGTGASISVSLLYTNPCYTLSGTLTKDRGYRGNRKGSEKGY